MLETRDPQKPHFQAFRGLQVVANAWNIGLQQHETSAKNGQLEFDSQHVQVQFGLYHASVREPDICNLGSF